MRKTNLLQLNSIRRHCKNCGFTLSKIDRKCKSTQCISATQRIAPDVAAFITNGLGRATRRGVRRCPKCGLLNGTKSEYCKNKTCNTAFKKVAAKKKSLEICKLDTGPFTRVYSVRANDRGPDYRGFVQLPLENTHPLKSMSLCFVDHCQGNFKTKVLECHELKNKSGCGTCSHIEAAERCSSDSIPLPVNVAVVEAMALDIQMKEDIFSLVSSCHSPVVQRVSRDSMAVKCSVSGKFPLGYLHATFMAGRSDQDLQFSCPCSVFKESARTIASQGRCVHFYICICAFVNQEHLRQEFASYIKLEIALGHSILEDESIYISNGVEVDGEKPEELEMLFDCQVEIMDTETMSVLLSDVNTETSCLPDSLEISNNGPHDPPSGTIPENIEISSDPSYYESTGSSSTLATVESDGQCVLSGPFPSDAIVFSTESFEGGSNEDLSLIAKVSESCVENEDTSLEQKVESDLELGLRSLMPFYFESVSEKIGHQEAKLKQGSRLHQSFLEWLASVTERINLQMHYDLPGEANSLIFQTPKKFFEKLRERIIQRTKRKKVLAIKSLTKRDLPPFGTFVKYSWSLDNRFHVKAIFDTKQMPLKLVQSFRLLKNGTFQLADERMINSDTQLYKTFLRVADTPSSPFIIEWVPDILPVSQIGELKLTFEFGHVPDLLLQ